jgi:hypothetical protein
MNLHSQGVPLKVLRPREWEKVVPPLRDRMRAVREKTI